ncbi:porin [Rhizobium panacihumi]|uniref:porin n=1 Tax=Rhizobium panacihumi TaxID=2008450 RepID=UPI003D79992E
MKMKSLLLGSAAALATVSAAQAADAIIAAEPEPMEYVRVCDAFGTGYFYIPGTETCLKIGGYVRIQIDGRSDADIDGLGKVQDGGYMTKTRGQLVIDAKSDTEFGTLASKITLRANNNSNGNSDFYLEDTYIELGGFRIGQFYNYFDIGVPGETVLADGGPIAGFGGIGGVRDGLGLGTDGYMAGDTLNNSVRYTFDNGTFQAYIQGDAFNSEAGWKYDDDIEDTADEVGINGLIAGKFGGVAIDLFGAYEFDNEDGVLASTLTAEIGPGSLGVFGVYSFGPSRYWDFSEWSIGAEYAIKVTDKFTIAPGAQYWDKILPVDGDYEGGTAWRVGVTADYEVTENLAVKATVNYTDVDIDMLGVGDGDHWDGFFRLQRSF